MTAPAEYTTTVRLADGTLATLRATWDAGAGRGAYTITDALGPWKPCENLDAAAFADAMRVLLGRREATLNGSLWWSNWLVRREAVTPGEGE